MEKKTKLLRLRSSLSGEIRKDKRNSITNILQSPRMSFSRSKSKEKISTSTHSLGRRKSRRHMAPRSETRFKSDGELLQDLEADTIPGDDDGIFALRAVGVNSMPDTTIRDSSIPISSKSRKKSKRIEKSAVSDPDGQISAKITALELENKKLRNEKMKRTLEAEKLKSNNASYLRRLKDIEQPRGENDSRKQTLGNLGRVSVYSDFARGMNLPGEDTSGNNTNETMIFESDISYVDRETLENMFRSLQSQHVTTTKELSSLKSKHKNIVTTAQKLQKELEILSQPSHHKISIKAEASRIEESLHLLDNLLVHVGLKGSCSETENTSKKRSSESLTTPIQTSPVTSRRGTKRGRSVSTFAPKKQTISKKTKRLNRSNSEKLLSTWDYCDQMESNMAQNLDLAPLSLTSPRTVTPRKLIFSKDSTKKKLLRSGDIFAILEWAIEKSHEPRDLEVFFVNYREFISSVELVNYFIDKCESHAWSPDVVRSSLQTLVYWTNDFAADFQSLEVLEHLESFLQRIESKEFAFKIRMIRMQLRICREKADSVSEVQNMALESLNAPATRLDLLSVPAVELARQFTLLEFTMYQCVDSLQLVSQKNRESDKNIKTIIQRFNRVSCWVATEILVVNNIKKRASMIKYFILVAQACRELRNFNTLLEITAGLNFSVIQRLRKTWKLVPSKYVTAFKNLEELMDCRSNFSRYRKVLSSSDLPCFPYFGIFLRDCAFIDVGNETYDANNFVNFEKLRLKCDVIRSFKRYQNSPYHFPVQYHLQNYLHNLCVFEDAVLQKHSIQYEPPAEV